MDSGVPGATTGGGGGSGARVQARASSRGRELVTRRVYDGRVLHDATTLHPRLREPAGIEPIRRLWAEERCLRIDRVLRPGLADELHDSASSGPFELFERREADVSVLLWRRLVSWSEAHPELEAVLRRDLPALLSAVCGRTLTPPEGTGAAFDLFKKGCYLDAHTDQAPHRVVAWVLGLTRDRWPAAEGGHLEFLEPDHQTVRSSRPPGFDTLDAYAIYPMLRPHRVPLLTTHRTRLATNGWLGGEVADPLEGG